MSTSNLNDEQVNCINDIDLHEIKNILSAARLSLEMLTTYDLDFEDRQKLTLQAFNSVNQSISIFEKMLKAKHKH